MNQVQQTAEQALQDIKKRSFSGRHPELGKMIKCPFCGLRHRENERKCERKFAKDKEGNERSTESLTYLYKGKRRKPHLNWRQNEFVQLVRSLVPDEYTQEELEKARAKARRILAKKYGRMGFLPPLWMSQKETREKLEAKNKAESLQISLQHSEAEVSDPGTIPS